jgi:hypothetical protein
VSDSSSSVFMSDSDGSSSVIGPITAFLNL